MPGEATSPGCRSSTWGSKPETRPAVMARRARLSIIRLLTRAQLKVQKVVSGVERTCSVVSVINFFLPVITPQQSVKFCQSTLMCRKSNDMCPETEPETTRPPAPTNSWPP